MEKRFGHFDVKNKEYVITDPRTPFTWMNYIFNDEYYAIVSATGGGYSFHRDAKHKRLLRYRLNNVPLDRPGRYCYIRRKDNGKYWSAGWAPVQDKPDAKNYKCRHGIGYTVLEYKNNGVKSRLSYVAPRDDSLELWNLELTNITKKTLDLDVFPYAEFCVFNAEKDMSNFQATYFKVRCFAEGNVIHHETPSDKDEFYAFFATDAKPVRWECDREKFFGSCRSEAEPIEVENGRLSNSDCYLQNPIASFQIPVKLRPGQTRTILFMLGTADNRAAGKKLITKYTKKESFDDVMKSVKEFWSDKLSSQLVETPDADTNLCLNQWHAYQAHVTFRVSRGPSIYEGGIGRGMGFRDSCQDTLGVAHVERERIRAHLVNLMRNQYYNGRSTGQYFRLTGKGEGGGNLDMHLWLVDAVCTYVKESGDMEFLKQRIPFFDKNEGTVYEHIKNAAYFSWKNRGEHGIPLMGYSDWNDCLEFKGWPEGRAESVMIAFQLVAALKELFALSRILENGDEKEFSDIIRKLTAIINKNCWDGEWYVRAFKDDGSVVGSKSCRFGKVWLNPQTWAVMSGVADASRGAQIMNKVRENLEDKYGVALFTPPWTKFDSSIGYRWGGLPHFNPGIKENGGIFCHTNSWAIIAEAMLGRGDDAYRYYAKLRPTEYDKIQVTHEAEPYVYAQTIAAKAHPRHGVAKNSWLTGSVAWMYRAATHHILGLRPSYDGLIVDPCVPASWRAFRVRRRFRDGFVNVHIKNPNGAHKGVKRVVVDGKEICGNIIPPPAKGREVNVEATM